MRYATNFTFHADCSCRAIKFLAFCFGEVMPVFLDKKPEPGCLKVKKLSVFSPKHLGNLEWLSI